MKDTMNFMTVADYEDFISWKEGFQTKDIYEALCHWMLLKRSTLSMN